jgi:hypothetical protein
MLILFSLGIFLSILLFFMIPVFIIILSLTIVILGTISFYKPRIIGIKGNMVIIRLLGISSIFIGVVLLLGGNTLFAKFYDYNNQSNYVVNCSSINTWSEDLNVSTKKDPPNPAPFQKKRPRG